VQLTALSIQNVRRIREAALDPSVALNLVVGANGSGKTSLLESVHFLASARSFRTTRTRDVISHGENTLVISGEVHDSQQRANRVGIEKSSSQTRLRLNGEAILVASQLARLMPVLNFNSESFLLLSGGPSVRRSLLDRLLFHVEHDYLACLKRYYRSLKQRNALLRSRGPTKEIRAWDEQIGDEVDNLDRWRSNCVDTINRYLEDSPVSKVIGELRLNYYRGWSVEKNFSDMLLNNLEKDRDAGLTTAGPHRAEIRFKLDDKLAKSIVSRGQGKLIIAAIVGAQSEYLCEHGSERPILLVDDLASELDRNARKIAVEALIRTSSQVFFTAIEAADLPRELSEAAKMFHVEHGKILPNSAAV
jgi:DNA replication and repair protein RecF